MLYTDEVIIIFVIVVIVSILVQTRGRESLFSLRRFVVEAEKESGGRSGRMECGRYSNIY